MIGDIHGCHGLLQNLLARLGDMPVLVLGDVVDRGPDSRAVVDTLIARRAAGVLGNHEEWLLAWLHGEGFDSLALKYWIGGEATLASYGVVGRTPRLVEAESWRVPAEHRAWLESLSVVIDLEVRGEFYWLIHGGIPSHLDLAGVPVRKVVPWLVDHDPRALLWSVTKPSDVVPVDRCVVMGHVIVEEAVDLGHVIAIDTGAGTGDGCRLTAVILPERRFVTVGNGSAVK